MMIIVTQDNGLEHRRCVSGCCWLPRSHDPDRKLCSLLPQVGADLIIVMRMVTIMLLNLRQWLMPRWLPRSHDPDRKLCFLLPQVGI